MRQAPYDPTTFSCSEEHYNLMVNDIEPLFERIHGFIVGQKGPITRTILALISTGQRDFKNRKAYLGSGHIRFVGPTGTGKTLLCKVLAYSIGGNSKKVQGTPDLMASDITGFEILDFNQGNKEQGLRFRKGPVFANVLLVDEINRIPPKAASGLIEAMAEGTITYGGEVFNLPEPFVVLATMNPSESGGTFSSDQEAVSDRFMFEEIMQEVTPEEMVEIHYRTKNIDELDLEPVVTTEKLANIRKFLFDNVAVGKEVCEYCARIIDAVNHPKDHGLFRRQFRKLRKAPLFRQKPPINPRSMLFLIGAAQAQAFVRYRSYVTPDDVQKIGRSVLRTRMSLLHPAALMTLIDDDGRYKTKSDLVEDLISEVLEEVPSC